MITARLKGRRRGEEENIKINFPCDQNMNWERFALCWCAKVLSCAGKNWKSTKRKTFSSGCRLVEKFSAAEKLFLLTLKTKFPFNLDNIAMQWIIFTSNLCHLRSKMAKVWRFSSTQISSRLVWWLNEGRTSLMSQPLVERLIADAICILQSGNFSHPTSRAMVKREGEFVMDHFCRRRSMWISKLCFVCAKKMQRNSHDMFHRIVNATSPGRQVDSILNRFSQRNSCTDFSKSKADKGRVLHNEISMSME